MRWLLEAPRWHCIWTKKEWLEPGPPNDMDIFVSQRNQRHIHAFLAQNGFSEIHTDQDAHYSYGSALNVTSFKKDSYVIQVIGFIAPLSTYKFIETHFDLNICMVYWNARTNEFKAIDVFNSKRRQIKVLRRKATQKRESPSMFIEAFY